MIDRIPSENIRASAYLRWSETRKQESARKPQSALVPLVIIGAFFLLGSTGCAIGNNARVSLGAPVSIGYNAGSIANPQESGMTNSVHRVGGGTVDAKAGALP